MILASGRIVRKLTYLVESRQLANNCESNGKSANLAPNGVVQFPLWCILFLLFCSSLSAQEAGIKVDLKEPHFCEGVLTTEKGGVISAPNVRIQARHISYTRTSTPKANLGSLVAEKDLIVEFGNYLFTGDRLEFDFQTNRGVIYNGRSAIEPWFFGGETIELCSDGNYILKNAYLTTSENVQPDWQIVIREAHITQELLLTAKGVTFRYDNIPILIWPSYTTNLAEIGESPLSYTVRWGGRQGPRFGVTYEAFSWRRFKTFFRVDYRLNRGLGFGIENIYTSADHTHYLETINYIAQDSSIVHPDEKCRYRLQGIYNNCQFGDDLSLDISWDKLSDKYMATDYYDKGLELDTAGRTQLHIRREKPNNISNFFVRLKANSFQTVKEELPTFQTHFHPLTLNRTGIIVDTKAKASYLDFRYANYLLHVHDYNAMRIEFAQNFYRPFQLNYVNILPHAGVEAIYYGNTPLHHPRWMIAGIFGIDLNTRLQRFYGNTKHVCVPYIQYNSITYPTTNPHDHYIFDIEDGWYRLNMLRFGIQQSFYVKDTCGYVERLVSADLWANAFFDTRTIPQTIPKMYGKLTWKSKSSLRHVLQTGWDFEQGMLDHFNFRTEWTYSANLALAAEYRHRDSYDWRKVDHDNFILDSFRSVHALRHSSLSDRRDTLLFHIFFRLHPNWAIEFESRQGWNRLHEPGYSEFEIDLLTTLRSAWNFKFSYRHQEDDDRIAVSLSIGLHRPNLDCPCIPFLEF